MTYLAEPTTAAEVMARARESYARSHRVVAPVPAVPLLPKPQADAAAISAGMREAHDLLSAMTAPGRPVPETVRQIVASVALEYGVPVTGIFGRSRSAHVHAARRSAMVRVKEKTDASTTLIGRWFGNRDHSTVVVAIAKDEWRAERSAKAAARIKAKRGAPLQSVPVWYADAVARSEAGQSHSQIGRAHGVSKKTVWRWFQKSREDLAARGTSP